MHNVTLIKGDGIGPSIMEAAVKIIDASGAKINWEEADAGMWKTARFILSARRLKIRLLRLTMRYCRGLAFMSSMR